MMKNKHKRLPPGPRGIPILGNMHMLGSLPHRALQALSKKYGPIMYMRPPHECSRHMLYDGKGISFSGYGPYWRSMRKLCTLELLTSRKINSFKPMRREEVGLLIKSLRKLRELGIKAVIQEAMQLAATPNIGDYIPCLLGLDLQGQTKDLVDVMLDLMGSEETEYNIQRANIKAISLDMMAASMDTSATMIEWALSELIKHPPMMKKVINELEKVVGMERMVEESDLESLEYLNMVVKETLRLHPVAPLLIPHESMEDCTVDGFHIPQKSRVIVNVWAIGRDPMHGLMQTSSCQRDNMLPSELDMTEEFASHYQGPSI
ncbi:Cytochrome P450 CYP736A12 [Vitis vinifera]|uniref:Cytochrome P450 CYP736A12 n=1 Tax=Vitis vinifera TaxID=29760 RepID=A0A438F4U0_VITVI|nr:Cytochrome P450 CYP736A12 [Vitis vinifera]